MSRKNNNKPDQQLYVPTPIKKMSLQTNQPLKPASENPIQMVAPPTRNVEFRKTQVDLEDVSSDDQNVAAGTPMDVEEPLVVDENVPDDE